MEAKKCPSTTCFHNILFHGNRSVPFTVHFSESVIGTHFTLLDTLGHLQYDRLPDWRFLQVYTTLYFADVPPRRKAKEQSK